MRLIIEEVDGVIYGDLIMTDEEATHLKEGALLESTSLIKHRRYYIGVRVGDKWRYTPPDSLFTEFPEFPEAE